MKLVIWDLDHTLWDGTLVEDGKEGVKIKTDILDIIKNLDAKGIVNSIASKNDEDRAMEALRYFGIDEYFVAPMINWGPKSKNIRAIEQALDIAMDRVVDSAQAGIRVLGLPHSPAEANKKNGAAVTAPS